MSLLNKVFGKREPLQRIGGVEALTKRGTTRVHTLTAQIVARCAKYHHESLSNILELETVVPLTLWSFILRGYCYHAPLWSPSTPQDFTEQLCHTFWCCPAPIAPIRRTGLLAVNIEDCHV